MEQNQKLFKFPPSSDSCSTNDSPIIIIEKSMKLPMRKVSIPITTLIQGSQKQLVLFCLVTFIFNVCLTFVIPFYPCLANEHAGLDFGLIGLVISCTPLGSIFGALIFGPRLNQFNRRNTLIISLILQSISLIAFGVLGYISNHPGVFIAISIISRFIQGVCRSINGTIIFSYLPILWPKTYEQKVGLLESQIILGIMAGPAIGAVFNYILGFSVPFYIISIFFLLIAYPTYKLIPEDNLLIGKSQKKTISLLKSFKSGIFLSTFISIAISVGTLTYMSPIFVHHMESFNINQDFSALIYSLPAISYFISIYVVHRLLKTQSKTIIIAFGLLLGLVAALFTAPFWTQNTQSYSEIMVALLIQGIAQAFVVIPSIPRILELMQPLYDANIPVNNLAPGIFLIAISIGNFLCPNISGKVYDTFGGNTIINKREKKGFQECLFVMIAMLSLNLIQFMIFGGGYESVKMARLRFTNNEKEQQLQERKIKLLN